MYLIGTYLHTVGAGETKLGSHQSNNTRLPGSVRLKPKTLTPKFGATAPSQSRADPSGAEGGGTCKHAKTAVRCCPCMGMFIWAVRCALN